MYSTSVEMCLHYEEKDEIYGKHERDLVTLAVRRSQEGCVEVLLRKRLFHMRSSARHRPQLLLRSQEK